MSAELDKKLKELDELKRKAKKLTGKGRADSDAGQRNRDQAARRSRENTQKVQEIGPIPAVSDANWKRREACLADPERFLRTYFGFDPYFPKPFCDDHRRVIDKGEDAIERGGLFALAQPRGHGKTTLCRALAIRAICRGRRRFVFFIGAASPHARRSLETIKAMIVRHVWYDGDTRTWGNLHAFAEDFPEIVYPAAALGRTINRQKGQTCGSVPTGIHWSGDHITLPSIAPQPSVRPEQLAAGGAIVFTSGLLGSGVTGMNVLGERPDLVILDDVQTRESAMNDAACEKRESIIAAMVTGLAAPGVKLAAIMPCTVIRQNDLSDRFLNHELHPEWAMERAALLRSMPTAMDLWDEYAEIRKDYDPTAGPESKAAAAATATEFYIDHQAAMDAGAEPSWPERYNHDEVSAVQNAMNLYLDNPTAFAAEMQNRPVTVSDDLNDLAAGDIAKKLNGIPRRTVPLDATRLTAFIDVQASILYWTVCGFADDFTGSIIDYGTFPDQRRPYFTLADVQKTLAEVTGAAGLEAQIYAGLKLLTEDILARTWKREGGQELRIEKCLVDANWGQSTNVVYQFCRQSVHSALLTPSHGKGVGATSTPINAAKRLPGEWRGLECRVPVQSKRAKGYVLYDTNFWKSFVRERLAVDMGGHGCLSLFGDSPSAHRMIADHLVSEKRQRVTAERTGRTVEEWTLMPGTQNHWWDSVVGCHVAANMLGVSLEGVHRSFKRPPPRPKMTLNEMKAKARAKER